MKNKLPQFKNETDPIIQIGGNVAHTLSIYFSNANLQRMVLKDWIYFAWYILYSCTFFRIQPLKKEPIVFPKPHFNYSQRQKEYHCF